MLSSPLNSANIQLKQLPSEFLLQRLAMADRSNRERHDRLQRLFAEDGCASSDMNVPHEEPNVVCVLPGETDAVILVGAHFDKVAQGMGVVDNWSGAALLPSLYQSMKVVRRKHTIIFLGFSGEEEGLIGSKFYVRHTSKEQITKIHAMLAIDTLGLSPTKVWSDRADKNLLSYLVAVSQGLNLPVSTMNVDQVGDTDSTPFREAKVPTITFHSITQDTFAILHTERDSMGAVDQKAYVDSCHLIAAYVAYLDEALDRPAAKTAR